MSNNDNQLSKDIQRLTGQLDVLVSVLGTYPQDARVALVSNTIQLANDTVAKAASLIDREVAAVNNEVISSLRGQLLSVTAERDQAIQEMQTLTANALDLNTHKRTYEEAFGAKLNEAVRSVSKFQEEARQAALMGVRQQESSQLETLRDMVQGMSQAMDEKFGTVVGHIETKADAATTERQTLSKMLTEMTTLQSSLSTVLAKVEQTQDSLVTRMTRLVKSVQDQSVLTAQIKSDIEKHGTAVNTVHVSVGRIEADIGRAAECVSTVHDMTGALFVGMYQFTVQLGKLVDRWSSQIPQKLREHGEQRDAHVDAAVAPLLSVVQALTTSEEASALSEKVGALLTSDVFKALATSDDLKALAKSADVVALLEKVGVLPTSEDVKALLASQEFKTLAKSEDVRALATSEDVKSLSAGLGVLATSEHVKSLSGGLGVLATSEDIRVLSAGLGVLATSEHAKALSAGLGVLATPEHVKALSAGLGVLATSEHVKALSAGLGALATSEHVKALSAGLGVLATSEDVKALATSSHVRDLISGETALLQASEARSLFEQQLTRMSEVTQASSQQDMLTPVSQESMNLVDAPSRPMPMANFYQMQTQFWSPVLPDLLTHLRSVAPVIKAINMRTTDVHTLTWLLMEHFGSAWRVICELCTREFSGSWYCIQALLEGRRRVDAIAAEDGQGSCRVRHDASEEWCIMVSARQFTSSHGTKYGLYVRRSQNIQTYNELNIQVT